MTKENLKKEVDKIIKDKIDSFFVIIFMIVVVILAIVGAFMLGNKLIDRDMEPLIVEETPNTGWIVCEKKIERANIGEIENQDWEKYGCDNNVLGFSFGSSATSTLPCYKDVEINDCDYDF